LALIAHYDDTPFWISAGTNKDDLECEIQLKVRFTDGTLDVCMLWLSELYCENSSRFSNDR